MKEERAIRRGPGRGKVARSDDLNRLGQMMPRLLIEVKENAKIGLAPTAGGVCLDLGPADRATFWPHL